MAFRKSKSCVTSFAVGAEEKPRDDFDEDISLASQIKLS